MSLTDEIDAFRHRAFRGLSSQADAVDKITNHFRRMEALHAEGMAELAAFFNGHAGFAETSLQQEPWPDPNGDLPPAPAQVNGNGSYGYHPPPPPPGYVPHPNGGIPPAEANRNVGDWPQVVQRQTQPQYPARRFK